MGKYLRFLIVLLAAIQMNSSLAVLEQSGQNNVIRGRLFVEDNITGFQDLAISGQLSFSGINPGQDRVLVSDANGNATWQDITLIPGAGGAFATNNNITSNSPGDFANDSLVFGSPQLDDDGDPDHDARTFFNKAKAAFRSGLVEADQWDDANVGTSSVSFGTNSISSGDNSFSAGNQTRAEGNASAALGLASRASGLASIAMGSMIADGLGAVGLGMGGRSVGQGAVAIGEDPETNGFSAIAIGSNPKALASAAVAIGNTSHALGTSSVAIGSLNISSERDSITIGSHLESNAEGAITIGNGIFNNNLINNQEDNIALGTNSNLATVNIAPAAGVGTTGNVGIATANPDPAAKLDINGAIKIVDGTQDQDRVLVSDANGLASWQELASVPGAGAFNTAANVTSNSPGDINNDDFVFGSTQLGDDGFPSHAARFFFDKSKGAFRAGRAFNDEWDDANVGLFSIAMGQDPIASGSGAIALGFSASATGNSSYAIGNNANASNGNTRAIGTNVTASGINSTAIGFNANATGNNSQAFGVNANALDSNTIAFGFGANASAGNAQAYGTNASASDINAVAIGFGADASAPNAQALGLNTVASANNTLSLGVGTIASASNSASIGRNNTANAINSLVLGKDSETTANAANSFVIGDDVFADAINTVTLGTGSGPLNPLLNDQANSLMIGMNSTEPSITIAPGGLNDSGDVGINTKTPNSKLHVVGDLTLENGNQADGRILSSNANGLSTWVDPLALSLGLGFREFAIYEDRSIGGADGQGIGNQNIRSLGLRRPINEVVIEKGNSISLNTNSFAITMSPGTYYIQATAAGSNVGTHRIIFDNITDNVIELLGTTANSNNSSNTYSNINGFVSVKDSNKTYSVNHALENSSNTAFGNSSEDLGIEEVYARITIIKISDDQNLI